jgi:hypothetical protein
VGEHVDTPHELETFPAWQNAGEKGFGRRFEEEHYIQLTVSYAFYSMSNTSATMLTMTAVEPKIRQLLERGYLLTWYNSLLSLFQSRKLTA